MKKSKFMFPIIWLIAFGIYLIVARPIDGDIGLHLFLAVVLSLIFTTVGYSAYKSALNADKPRKDDEIW